MLRLVLTTAAMALMALAQSAVLGAQSCAHYTQDVLLDRLDARLAACVDEQRHRAALDIVKDRFATNEFDRQQPLALAVFSNSSQTLDTFAGAIASALFGSSAAAHASVQVLDLAQLIPQTLLASTPHDVKQTLRAALAASLAACPERSLFVVENVQMLDDATLPVLDTFLDPLNGARAHFQLHAAGGRSQLLDSTRAVFLFLFQVERAHFDGAAHDVPLADGVSDDIAAGPAEIHKPLRTWRDFLMRTWTRRSGLVEEFTPQAFVGRLTDGVVLFASEGAGESRPPQDVHECLAHKAPRSASSDRTTGVSYESVALQRLAWAAIPLLALLYRTKLWTQDVAVKRTTRGSIRGGGKRSHAKRSKRSGSSSKKSRKRS